MTDSNELTSPDITALLDVQHWALGVLQQTERIRAGWLELQTLERLARAPEESEDDSDPEAYELWERVQLDVHYLAIAANQLIKARRQRTQARLPRVDRKLTKAIERLRTIREHYESGHRDAFYGGPATGVTAALRSTDVGAHPWAVRGSVYNGLEVHDVVVAGVLPLDDLDAHARALREAADLALQQIVERHRRERG